jgi:serine/threonine protein kinase
MADRSAEPVATVVNGHTFTIDTRYVLKDSRILGKGSFGVVCTAYDSVRRIDIAIKRIRPYANDEWDAKHTLREIRLLRLLGPHPNVSKFTTVLLSIDHSLFCRLLHCMK